MAPPQTTPDSRVPPPPPAVGTDRTPHLELWHAISRRAWFLLGELSLGPALFGLEAICMLRYAANTLPFFHQNVVLPIAVLVGFRVGSLLFVKCVAAYMVNSIRKHGWAHDDSIEAFEECIRPALFVCKFLVLSQTFLALAECTNALRLFAHSQHDLHAIACWPIVGVGATAAMQLAVEWTRMDHWRDALGKLHDMDVAKTTNKVMFNVPAKLRSLAPDEESSTCCICLSECMPGEALAELRCKHVFHEACIKTWLQRVDSCPLRCSTGSVRFCKQPVTKKIESKIGDFVEVKNTDSESWRRGKVVSTAPFLVRPCGWLYAYPWEFAQASANRVGASPEARILESMPSHEHQD